MVGVSDGLASRVRAGSTVEVAYAVDNEKDFVIVEDLEEKIRVIASTQSCSGFRSKILCCVMALLMILGVAIGASSILTGCLLGWALFFVILVGGVWAGYFVCFPVSRLITRLPLYINTSGGPAPSESLESLVLGRSVPELDSFSTVNMQPQSHCMVTRT